MIDKPYVYRGFRMVNEQKLRDMRGDELRKLNQNGMLPLIYAHLFLPANHAGRFCEAGCGGQGTAGE